MQTITRLEAIRAQRNRLNTAYVGRHRGVSCTTCQDTGEIERWPGQVSLDIDDEVTPCPDCVATTLSPVGLAVAEVTDKIVAAINAADVGLEASDDGIVVAVTWPLDADHPRPGSVPRDIRFTPSWDHL